MRVKLLPLSIVLAVGVALAISGAASAGGGAKTKVTIEAESGGFFGFVKSKKEKCKNERLVTLYKQKGKKQNRKKDTKVASDTSQANGDGYMWSTGNTGQRSGKFYAFAKKIPGCKKGSSKTVKAQR